MTTTYDGHDDNDDFIRRQLASLRTDVDGLSMPGPTAARQRAAQRTRHQITGTALAGIAAVAVAAVGITQPTLFTAPEPSDPSVTDTITVLPPTTPPTSPPLDPTTPPAEPTADPTGSDEPDLPQPPPEGALLTVDDLVDDNDSEFGITWAEVPPLETPDRCMPALPDGALEAHFGASQSGGPVGHRVDQFVETTNAPEQRLSDLMAQLQACVAQGDDSYQLVDIWPVTGVGDEAWITRFWAPTQPPNEDTALQVTVNAVRSGGYTSVVIDSFQVQDVNGGPDLDRIAAAGTRLCDALGTACVDSPAQGTRIYPEVNSKVPGWLDSEEAGSVLDLRFDDAPELPLDGQQLGWAHSELPADPMADGAQTIEWRRHLDSFVPDGGPSLDQLIATFPDTASAKAHYDRLVAATDTAFDQDEKFALTNTGGLNENGIEATSWRLEDTVDGYLYVYGTVVQEDQVSVLYHRIDPWEGRDVTPDQLHQLLQLAGEGLTMR